MRSKIKQVIKQHRVKFIILACIALMMIPTSVAYKFYLLNSSLSSEITELSNKNEELENQIESLQIFYEKAVSGYNSRIRSLTEEIDESAKTIEELNQEISDLKSKAEEQEVQEEKSYGGFRIPSSWPQSSSDGVSSSNDNVASIVYWTPSGEVYHSTSNCATLKKSKTIHSGTISESGKSRACKVCF